MAKSSIIRQLAEEANLHLIDNRLSSLDPIDFMGVPVANKDKTRATYAPMDLFPLATDPIPDGKQGFVVFLDEATSGRNEVQAACYRFLLDRQIGVHNVHPNTFIVAAGNYETDRAVSYPMSSALASRLIHFNIIMDPDDWLEWAAITGIDKRIQAFIRWKPSILETFDPQSDDQTYACARTWHFASDLIKDEPNLTDPNVRNMMTTVLCGTVSEGPAREFLSFCEVYNDPNMPSITRILNDPLNTVVPDNTRPDISFALIGTLADKLDEDTADAIIQYSSRLEPEFQMAWATMIVPTKGNVLSNNQHWRKWTTKNHKKWTAPKLN